MIFLDPYDPRILDAKQQHLDMLLPILRDRVAALPHGNLKNFLNELRINRILSDLPNNLENHHLEYLNIVHGLNSQNWKDYLTSKSLPSKKRSPAQRILINDIETRIEELEPIFKYTGYFAKKSTPYSTYNLAEKLNVHTCIYCNRIYTKTVINPHKVTRPEFDHWFPKSTYPLLALSFYNLIPSCHICNSSVKSTTLMNINEYLHPYIPQSIDLKFSYWIESANKYKFCIKMPRPSKEHNTIKAFKIEEIYETHRDEINDLVRLRRLYSIDYVLKLKSLLKVVDNNVSMEEIYRLAFGTHYEEKNFSKRPLSKMKKDILEELGMILK